MADFAYRDGRFYKDGHPFFVIGVEYQYYRDRRRDWEPRLRMLRAAHANTVTFYVPWRHHLVSGAHDFTGATRDNRDLETFLRVCTDLGLWMIAKPGPFVHSELNIGGLPDSASPSFAPGIEPVRAWDGSPLVWEYDGTLLPSPADPGFDAMARGWLEAAGRVLAPHASPGGNLIAVQLNDETLYCTSNSPPWTFGYEMRPGPALGERPERVEDLRAWIEWAEFQWRVRREAYARYAGYLGLDLPALTNFAGIAPPIEENVPGREERARPAIPEEYARLYPEWWLAMNRIDADREVYEYGIISWLGVAAYDIADPSDVRIPEETGRNEVFCRYLTTAGRRRGINMEENWGFAKLYHPFSRFPIVPFFQTLASVAGGCTGYVVFCGVQHEYWSDDLDRVTKQQWPTFPSDAPIAADGAPTPMYRTMAMLNEWFFWEGERYLLAEPDPGICWLIYPPYAAVSGWMPDDEIAGHEVPRCGVEGLETMVRTLQQSGFTTTALELDAVTVAELASRPVCALRLGFFMDAAAQRKLLEYVRRGGLLITAGEPPSLDLGFSPCPLLADAIAGELTRIGAGRLFWARDNFFAGPGVLAVLQELGVEPRVRTSRDLRAFVYRHERDAWVWFFHFGRSEETPAFVEFDGRRLDLVVGPKSCGVVHLADDRLASVLLKGRNEVEDRVARVEVRLGRQVVSRRGDLLHFL